MTARPGTSLTTGLSSATAITAPAAAGSETRVSCRPGPWARATAIAAQMAPGILKPSAGPFRRGSLKRAATNHLARWPLRQLQVQTAGSRSHPLHFLRRVLLHRLLVDLDPQSRPGWDFHPPVLELERFRQDLV